MKSVTFGMRFSHFLLMISLYLILTLHAKTASIWETNFRNMIYNLSYMDNLAFSSNNAEDLLLACPRAESLFGEFGFKLQQFGFNSPEIMEKLPEFEPIKVLYGGIWRRICIHAEFIS